MIHLLQELDELPDVLPNRLAEFLRKPVRNTRGEIVGEGWRIDVDEVKKVEGRPAAR